MKVRQVVPFVLSVVASVSVCAQGPSWTFHSIDDPLHAKVHNQFVLEGKYLTPPNKPIGQPPLTVSCTDGRFDSFIFEIGGIVDEQRASVEGRIDGKAKPVGIDGRSTDQEALFLSTFDVKKVINAKLVILGAQEYLGPQVVVQFDMPDPGPIYQSCSKEKR
jgi:hypothetical protein